MNDGWKVVPRTNRRYSVISRDENIELIFEQLVTASVDGLALTVRTFLLEGMRLPIDISKMNPEQRRLYLNSIRSAEAALINFVEAEPEQKRVAP